MTNPLLNKNNLQKARPRNRLVSTLLCLLAIPAFAAPLEVKVNYSTGTGFFVDREGHIITNNHVVTNCQSIAITGAVPETFAEIVARDLTNDLALLKIGATGPGIGQLRDERYPVTPDEPVVTVGFPGGRGPVTREAKIIAARGPLGETKWLQFTDSIARGNSGGPLLDSAGNVVGVVVGKMDRYLVNLENMKKEKELKIDLAISMEVVRGFLSGNGVRWRDGAPGGILASHRLEDRAKEYIVNVRCRLG